MTDLRLPYTGFRWRTGACAPHRRPPLHVRHLIGHIQCVVHLPSRRTRHLRELIGQGVLITKGVRRPVHRVRSRLSAGDDPPESVVGDFRFAGREY